MKFKHHKEERAYDKETQDVLLEKVEGTIGLDENDVETEIKIEDRRRTKGKEQEEEIEEKNEDEEKEKEGEHMVFCVHGFMGIPTHMSTIIETLVDKHPKRLIVLNSVSNRWGLTMDGVDHCGVRLADEIQEHLNKNPQVKKFSIIGYSFGGLVARYGVTELYLRGCFEFIELMNFVTFASPHLGSRKNPVRAIGKIFNKLAPFFGSRTGKQLQLEDSFANEKPLLQLMSEKDSIFFHVLSLFKKRMLFANIFNDRSVSYSSASIKNNNPYRKHKHVVQYETYPHIVIPNFHHERDPVKPKKVPDEVLFGGILVSFFPLILTLLLGMTLLVASSQVKLKLKKSLRHLIHEKIYQPSCTSKNERDDEYFNWLRNFMVEQLNQMEWERVDVKLDSSNTHGPIIVRARSALHKFFDQGDDVVKYLADNFNIE